MGPSSPAATPAGPATVAGSATAARAASSASPLHLFLAGPTYVRPEILAAMTRPMIGHRSAEFAELYAGVRRKLLAYAATGARPILATGSATMLLEAGIRSLVPRRSLHAVCGAFGRRWEEIARANGKSTAVVEAPAGKAVGAEAIAAALAGGGFDAVCLTHSETSTGVLHDLAAVAAAVRTFPEVLFLVDAVSSFAATPIDLDGLGIDFLVTGTQKALALPPGMAIGFASERALARARRADDAGWYLSLARFEEFDERDNTPTTPNIPLFYALDRQLDDLLRETAARRFERHRRMAAATEAFCARNGLSLLPEPGSRSPAVSVVVTEGFDAERLRAAARTRGWVLSSGYGALKGRSFRIGHMGDHDDAEVAALLAVLEEILTELQR